MMVFFLLKIELLVGELIGLGEVDGRTELIGLGELVGSEEAMSALLMDADGDADGDAEVETAAIGTAVGSKLKS